MGLMSIFTQLFASFPKPSKIDTCRKILDTHKKVHQRVQKKYHQRLFSEPCFQKKQCIKDQKIAVVKAGESVTYAFGKLKKVKCLNLAIDGATVAPLFERIAGALLWVARHGKWTSPC